jgi:hypothetical protein
MTGRQCLGAVGLRHSLGALATVPRLQLRLGKVLGICCCIGDICIAVGRACCQVLWSTVGVLQTGTTRLCAGYVLAFRWHLAIC